MLIRTIGTQQPFDLTIWTLVASWLFTGLLCLAPLAWVLKKRLTGEYQLSNPDHLWGCREAAAFSLFASPLWWLAPALIQASGH